MLFNKAAVTLSFYFYMTDNTFIVYIKKACNLRTRERRQWNRLRSTLRNLTFDLLFYKQAIVQRISIVNKTSMRTEELNYGTANPFSAHKQRCTQYASQTFRQIDRTRQADPLCLSGSLRFHCLFYYTNLVSRNAPPFLGGEKTNKQTKKTKLISCHCKH